MKIRFTGRQRRNWKSWNLMDRSALSTKMKQQTIDQSGQTLGNATLFGQEKYILLHFLN